MGAAPSPVGSLLQWLQQVLLALKTVSFTNWIYFPIFAVGSLLLSLMPGALLPAPVTTT